MAVLRSPRLGRFACWDFTEEERRDLIVNRVVVDTDDPDEDRLLELVSNEEWCRVAVECLIELEVIDPDFELWTTTDIRRDK